MQKLSNLLLDHGLHRILSSYWVVHFYLMKKSAKMLLYFGLDSGMLEFEHMQTVIQTSRRLDSFLHEAAQNFELLSNILDPK